MTYPSDPEGPPPQQPPQQPPPYRPTPPPGHYPGPRLAGLPPDHPEMAAYRRRKRKRMFIVGGVMVLLIGAVLTAIALDPDPSNAAVGDCLSGTSGSNMRTRSCDDPKAAYKVVEVHDGVSSAQAMFVCESSDTEKYFFKNGKVLCLAPYTP
jgi:hypothetical protein